MSELQTMSPIDSPKLCIDRITLLMHTGPVMGFYGSSDSDYIQKKKSAINDFIFKMKMRFMTLFDKVQPSGETGLYLYHFRLLGEFDLQMCPRFGIRSRIDDEGYINAFCTEEEKAQYQTDGFINEYFDSDYGIRLEWNPAKADISLISELLLFLCDSYRDINPDISFDHLFKVTRFDVAVDYPEALNPALFTVMRKRKNGTNGGSDGLETVYFGSRRTFFYWRIYDKKRELLEEQHINYLGSALWRVEVECKKTFSIGEDSHFICHEFRNLEYFYGVSTGDWKFDFMLHYAKCFGIQNALKSIDNYNTRKSYQERLSKLDMDSIKHPAYIVGWKLPPMWREFYNKFKNCCGRQDDPMLYRRNVREEI